MKKIFIPNSLKNEIPINRVQPLSKIIVKDNTNNSIGIVIREINANKHNKILYSIISFGGVLFRNGEDSHYETLEDLIEHNKSYNYYMLEK